MRKKRWIILAIFLLGIFTIIYLRNEGIRCIVDEPQEYLTPKDSMYGNPTKVPDVAEGIELNPNMTPFIHQHQDGVQPRGVSLDTPWKYGTIIRNQLKPNWTRVGVWGQVYLQEGEVTIPENVGIELKDLQMYILNPLTLAWELLLDVVFTEENTLFYDDNFTNNYHQQFYQHKKIQNDGHSVIIRFDEENINFNFHPYSNERFDFVLNNYVMDDGFPYIISRLDARLVKWDQSQSADFEQAPFIFNVGGDYWDSVENEWDETWSANGEIGGGPFIKITPEFKTAWFTNVPYELCDELIPEIFTSNK